MTRAGWGLALGLVALAMAGPAADAAPGKARAVARMKGTDGSAMGTASFVATSGGVLIQFDMKGLTPGVHAIHVHTSGSCDASAAFTSAGPHYAPDPKRTHGYMSAHGPHAGDLPNQVAAADGTLKASVFTTAFSLGNGKKSVFDRDGAALVVHAKGDDYRSQPAGAAGDRVACGVIVRTAAPGGRGAHRTHK